MMDDPPTSVERRVAARVQALRAAAGLSLEALAERSGVSRAMISRVERGEASATASLLGRLAAALDITLSALFAEDEPGGAPLARRAAQTTWRDPATGYLRRDVAPPGMGSPVHIVEVEFPAGAEVAFARPWPGRSLDQHVWLLEGGPLELSLGDEVWRLETGDCLHMRLDRPTTFRNPGQKPVRYAVILSGGRKRGDA